MKKFIQVTSAVICAVSVITLSGCLKYTSNILDVTTPGSNNDTQSQSEYQPVITTAQTVPVYTTVPMATEPDNTASQEQTTALQGEQTTNPEQTTAEVITTQAQNEQTTADVSAWSNEQILAYAKEAVNKTKAFTGNVSAKHTEKVDINITKAPGGSMVQGIINRIVGGVVEPTDETLNFSGGRATNTDGESVQLLLPTDKEFSLDISGVAAASARKDGANTIVTLTLPSETGTLTTPPVHNAASIGYLDASTLDLSAVTLNYIDVTYKGSVITLTVNADGYVVSADYSVPLGIKAEGKAIGITAQIEAEAQDSEQWSFSW